MQFQKAQRKRAKLRLALAGPAGSGKTTAALLIAKGLRAVYGGKIAVIDTERGSASLYSDLVEFDTLELDPPYSPERFIEAVHAAEAAKYYVLIVESATHEWAGSGGCLEINELVAASRFKGNTWSAWSETGARHRRFIDALLQSPCHVIATVRSKTETIQEGGKGKKIGMKMEQREGFEYEASVVLELEHEKHLAYATKDRTRLFSTRDPFRITSEVGRELATWLDSGAELAPEPPKEIPTGVTPHPEPYHDQDAVAAHVTQFCADVDNENTQGIVDRWAAIKGEMSLANDVWQRLKRDHKKHFDIIKATLTPKQEKVA